MFLTNCINHKIKVSILMIHHQHTLIRLMYLLFCDKLNILLHNIHHISHPLFLADLIILISYFIMWNICNIYNNKNLVSLLMVYIIMMYQVILQNVSWIIVHFLLIILLNPQNYHFHYFLGDYPNYCFFRYILFIPSLYIIFLLKCFFSILFFK